MMRRFVVPLICSITVFATWSVLTKVLHWTFWPAAISATILPALIGTLLMKEKRKPSRSEGHGPEASEHDVRT